MACLVALLTGTAAAQPPADATPPRAEVLFQDVTDSSGVTFEQRSAPEKKYILESMSGGVALIDYDNDGLLDIYFVNSLTVETSGKPETAPSALYQNKGSGKFVDVAVKAGVAYPGWGVGVCAADVDGDGWQDFYVTGVGGNRLYRNNQDGTFTDVAEKAGVSAGGWSTGCGFADYDRDGHLDLFVSRYVRMDLDDLPVFGQGKTCQYRGIAVQCGPRGLPGTSDLLFHNNGDETFTEVSEKAGVNDPEGYYGLGVAWFDADGDGWLDLFVANDANPNFFYRNKGDGTFEEEAFPQGVAVSEDGGEQGCMGVAVGDFRNEGRFGLFVSNFSEEYNALYRNQGSYFTDVSFRSASAPPSLPYVGWGAAWLDYDHDGWLDVLVVNGHVYPQLATVKLGASASYRQRKLLYRNLGIDKNRRITFEEVGTRFGEVFAEERVSRGLALGDLDNDGRPDAVVNDLDGKAQILRNVYETTGHWLMVKLVGKGKNTSAIGAVVTVTAGQLVQKRLVRSGTGYLSQDDLRQHFGLGSATRADSVVVLWPDGTTTTKTDVEVDQLLTIEGQKRLNASSRRR